MTRMMELESLGNPKVVGNSKSASICVSKTRNKKGNLDKIRKTFWGIASQFAS